MVVLKYIVAEVRRLIHPSAVIPVKIGEYSVPDNVVRNTLGFLLFYLGIFLVIAVVLSFFELDMVSAFSAAASALANIGPAFGTVGPYDNYAHLADAAKWILSFAMMLGRLEIFTIMVMFSRSFWR